MIDVARAETDAEPYMNNIYMFIYILYIYMYVHMYSYLQTRYKSYSRQMSNSSPSIGT